MIDEHSCPMTPFDEMIGDEQLQLLKASLPYFPPNGQRLLSIYAKTMELRNTLSLFLDPMQAMNACEAQKTEDPAALIEDLSRYCGEQTKEQLNQLLELFTMMQMVNEMQEP